MGYMVARIFVNHENHFMVEGKRQLGFLYNDFINSKINKDKMKSIIQSSIIYCLGFDLLVPKYDLVKEVSVREINQITNDMKMSTAKRLGFEFRNNNEIIE